MRSPRSPTEDSSRNESCFGGPSRTVLRKKNMRGPHNGMTPILLIWALVLQTISGVVRFLFFFFSLLLFVSCLFCFFGGGVQREHQLQDQRGGFLFSPGPQQLGSRGSRAKRGAYEARDPELEEAKAGPGPRSCRCWRVTRLFRR